MDKRVNEGRITASGHYFSPRSLLIVFVGLFCGALAFGWLHQTPSQEELYGDMGRFISEAWEMLGSSSWWSPHFLQGQSNSPYFLSAFPLIFGSLCYWIFGDPVGLKVAALLVVPLSAFAMFAFVRCLTRNEWTALVAAILYVVNAQMLLRIGNFEHWMGAYSYVFPPLILWAFLKNADEGSWRAVAWLALAWSCMMLSYAKLTFMFVPLAGMFFVWLLFDRPERRVALAMRWIVMNARSRGEKTMRDRLAGEFVDSAQGRGNAVEKKDDTHKMTEANKAFAHYRW